MDISFHKRHKSISDFAATTLPSFTVVTGLNGSGKTHLLEAIDSGDLKCSDVSDPKTEIRYFTASTFVPNDGPILDARAISEQRQQRCVEFVALREQAKSRIQRELRRVFRNVDLPEVQTHIERRFDESSDEPLDPRIAEVIDKYDQELRKQLQLKSGSRGLSPILQLTKSPFLLSDVEFHDLIPLAWLQGDPFQQSLAQLFMAYASKRTEHNALGFERCRSEGERLDWEKSFEKTSGKPPWDLINSIFQRANLPYCVIGPSTTDVTQHRKFQATLTHAGTGASIKFSDLSSGEKVIASLALCMYYAEEGQQLVGYPKTLLLDEVDATLHPSMISLLLRVIEQTLVGQIGINVVLTTHSPTTVALAPEESLFVLKSKPRQLLKTTRDQALAVLCANVPTLSVSIENRRQAFVESPVDADLYLRAYIALRSRLNTPFSLDFIAVGDKTNAGCDQVRRLVTEFSSCGNKTVFGVVDWDGKSKPNDRISVLAQDRRYALENTILDPLLLGILLLLEKPALKVQYGLSADDCVMDVRSFEVRKLQLIADSVSGEILQQMGITGSSVRQECEFVGGFKLQIPAAYLHHQGHNLESAAKEAFPALKRYQNEAALKREVITRVIAEMPSFAPVELLQLFEELTTAGRCDPVTQADCPDRFERAPVQVLVSPPPVTQRC